MKMVANELDEEIEINLSHFRRGKDNYLLPQDVEIVELEYFPSFGMDKIFSLVVYLDFSSQNTNHYIHALGHNIPCQGSKAISIYSYLLNNLSSELKYSMPPCQGFLFLISFDWKKKFFNGENMG